MKRSGGPHVALDGDDCRTKVWAAHREHDYNGHYLFGSSAIAMDDVMCPFICMIVEALEQKHCGAANVQWPTSAGDSPTETVPRRPVPDAPPAQQLSRAPRGHWYTSSMRGLPRNLGRKIALTSSTITQGTRKCKSRSRWVQTCWQHMGTQDQRRSI